MRSVNRIETIMRTIEQLWRKYPDMRLCQLIANITGPGDCFYLEDDEFLEKLVQFQCSIANSSKIRKKTIKE